MTAAGDTVAEDAAHRDDAVDPPRTGARGWVVLSLLFLFMIINFADKALLGVAADPIMQDLSLSPSQYGTVSSGFFLLFSISSLVVGFLTVRFPARRILIVMALVWTVAQCLMISPAAGFMTLLLTRVLLGAGEGPSYGVTNHAAMKWFPASRRGIATAAVGIAVPLGTMIAAPVLGHLIIATSWRITFFILGLASLAWAAAWIAVGREGPFDEPSAVRTSKAGAADPGSPAVPYRRILLSRTFLGSLAGGVVAYWSMVLLISWVPPYLATTQGFSPDQVGSAVAVPWGVQILAIIGLGGLLSTWLIKRGVSVRWARGAVAGAAVITSGATMIAFVHADSDTSKTVLMALAFGVGTCVIPMSQAINADICPPRQRGAVLGIYVAVYSLTGVIAPAVTGALVENAASQEAGFDQMFLFSGGLLLVGGLLSALLINPERDRARLEPNTSDRK